jgi:hypothetical protein
MTWFRNRQRLVQCLVGLFLLAQFAGAVPRLAHAHADAAMPAAHADRAHAHDHAGTRGHAGHRDAQHHHHGDQGASLADLCCALHLLTAVVPLVDTAPRIEPFAQPPVDASAAAVAGIDANALFRPPRSLQSL